MFGQMMVEPVVQLDPGVETNPDTRTRKAVAGHRQQATQNPYGSYCGGHVAGNLAVLCGFDSYKIAYSCHFP